MIDEQLTYKIIGCAYRVSNTLCGGFLEKVYEKALVHELRKAGLRVAQQFPLKIYYDNIVVGDYIADILVEESVIVELKAVSSLNDAHVAQCLNYLKATGLVLALLFGSDQKQEMFLDILCLFSANYRFN